MFATTPRGSCVICSRISAPARTDSGPSAVFVWSRKKSIRPATAFSSLRDCAIGFPVSVVSVRASSSFLCASRILNFSMALRRPPSGTAAQAGCAARARAYFAATAGAPSSASSPAAEPSAGLRIFTRGLEKIVQQRRSIQHAIAATVQELRVPLHARHILRTREPQRLDHAVVERARFDREPLAQPVHRLVVERIHFRPRDSGVERGELRAGKDLDLVVFLVVDRDVLVALRAGFLRRGVLVERAAERDVDELLAAANAQYRFSQFQESFKQFDLIAVALGIAGPLGPQRFLAVHLRRDVVAALQDKAVEFGRIV